MLSEGLDPGGGVEQLENAKFFCVCVFADIVAFSAVTFSVVVRLWFVEEVGFIEEEREVVSGLHGYDIVAIPDCTAD